MPVMKRFTQFFIGGRNRKLSLKKSETSPATIVKLREMEELLTKKQAYLEQKIQQELDIARKNGLKNKRVSIMALKRKKRYETQLKQIDGTLCTLEVQREHLEGTNTNISVLITMQTAAGVLKEAQKHLDVDKIQDVLEDIQEQQDIATDLSEAISNPIGLNSEIDEDVLEKELQELEQEDLDNELLSISPIPPGINQLDGQKPGSSRPHSGGISPSRRVDLDDGNPKRLNQNIASIRKDNEDDKVLEELQAWGAN